MPERRWLPCCQLPVTSASFASILARTMNIHAASASSEAEHPYPKDANVHATRSAGPSFAMEHACQTTMTSMRASIPEL